jgi:hypothetical protein
VLVCGFLAAAFSALVVLGVPRGGDLAAHLYRTGLVRHGVLVWDNLWFAGQYPLSSYSLLYYLFAAVIGNAALGIAGVAVAAAIFASVAQREWDTVGPWPARVFAVVLAGQAFTAAYPYDMGLATLLATLWALQRGRLWLAACCIVLTLGFSPLAFVLLALALLALFLRRPRVDRRAVVVAVVGLLARAPSSRSSGRCRRRASSIRTERGACSSAWPWPRSAPPSRSGDEEAGRSRACSSSGPPRQSLPISSRHRSATTSSAPRSSLSHSCSSPLRSQVSGRAG